MVDRNVVVGVLCAHSYECAWECRVTCRAARKSCTARCIACGTHAKTCKCALHICARAARERWGSWAVECEVWGDGYRAIAHAPQIADRMIHRCHHRARALLATSRALLAISCLLLGVPVTRTRTCERAYARVIRPWLRK